MLITRGTWRSRVPITAQVLVLAMVVVAFAQSISFAVIVLTPAPPAPRMTLAEAHAALASQRGAQAAKLSRKVSENPPFAPSAASTPLYGAAIAYGLRVAPLRVRVRQLGNAASEAPVDQRSLVITTPRQGPSSAHLQTAPTAPELVAPETARLLLGSGFSLPAFEATWHRADGRWVTIGPQTPWSADWRARLAISLALGLTIVVPLAWLASRHLTKPIRALAEAADSTRLGTHPLFGEDGPPEIRAASSALRAMHGRLETQFAERMRMLVAIAHDLRTPLTALRLRIESDNAHEHRRQAGLVDRMERMIREILSYAGASQPEPVEAVDVAALVRAQLPEVDRAGRPVRFHGLETAMLNVPPVKLSRITANLIENAVRYATDVEVSVTRQPPDVVITVDDRGPGVPDADLRRVVEPFVRLEPSRSRQTGGIGLGLTIAHDLAMEMGAALALWSRVGGGLSVSVRFADNARSSES